MRRKKSFILSVIIAIIVFGILSRYVKNNINGSIVENLEGEIYYTKRIDGVLTVFRSDANLENEELVYSHKGRGEDSSGGYNDNVINFYYNKENDNLTFIAMDKGEWSLFYLKEGQDNPTLLERDGHNNFNYLEFNTDYIKDNIDKTSVIDKEGSIYLIENNEERLLKKFYGAYDEKFTGYRVKGFSPDGKYLIYYSMEHLTSLGTIMESFFDSKIGHNYIMDISTGKSTRYVDADNIQWRMDKE